MTSDFISMTTARERERETEMVPPKSEVSVKWWNRERDIFHVQGRKKKIVSSKETSSQDSPNQ